MLKIGGKELEEEEAEIGLEQSNGERRPASESERNANLMLACL